MLPRMNPRRLMDDTGWDMEKWVIQGLVVGTRTEGCYG